jgi:FkbM family methyltransferase
MPSPQNFSTGPAEPFGTYRLSAWESFVIGLTRAMPQGWAGKRLALLFRKLVSGAMARPVDIEVFGYKMRLNGARNVAERRLLIQPQHFDPDERAALAAHLKPGDIAIDIGANVGAYTLFMAGLVGLGGRVIAVEPQPSVLQRLKENLSFNPVLTVTVAATALGASEGEVTFETNARNEGEGRITSTPGAQGFTVALTTLQALLAREGVGCLAALKIDVEGAEPQVLLPFFQSAPAELWPKLIVLERGDSRWGVDLVSALQEFGYDKDDSIRLNWILRRV